MDDLDLAILICEEADESSEEERRREESALYKKRKTEGAYEILICRHLIPNEIKFKEYFRLTPELFHYVLNIVKEDIAAKPCNRIKKPISAEQKLCIFLRFLATGESYRSLAFQFRICHSWIGVIVRQVANNIVNRMLNAVIPPLTMEDFRKIARQFLCKWNFPNCIGAVDGKHVRIKAPNNSASLFFNYKEFYSIVMLAIVDADLKFVAIDIGSYGREGDAGIFLKSNFGRRIINKEFTIPPPGALPGTNTALPHVILGDEAFALHENLMKPYPRRQSVNDQSKAVYNYRLSRARRCTENAFGILCAYFRIFFQPIAVPPETTDKLITSACILYNLLREAKVLAPNQVTADDFMHLPTENLMNLAENNVRARQTPLEIRHKFQLYFNGPGAIEWQNLYCREH